MSDFESVPVGTTAELERVKRDRDEWKQVSRDRRNERDSCKVRLADARRQLNITFEREQALAAHVEVGKALVRDLLVDDITDDATRLIEWCALDTPSISLARRDLIKQAEVLEYMGEEVESMHTKANKDGIAAHLTHISRGYRQKADQLEEDPCQS